MTFDVKTQVELPRGEDFLHGWTAELVTGPGSKGESGWLILTSFRCLFFRQVGFLGGRRLEKPASFAVKLERLRSLSARPISVEIGYGDHVTIPGVEVDGKLFRLDREASAESVVAQIRTARTARPL